MPAPGVQYPNNSIPFWDDGDEITCKVDAVANGGLISGSRFVRIAGNTVDGTPLVRQCAAGESAFGVSAFDGDASGQTAPDHITVWHARSKIVAVKAGAALAAGGLVQSDAAGQAIPKAAGVAVGTVIFDAALGDQSAIDRSQLS
jgi:hypothetical protein